MSSGTIGTEGSNLSKRVYFIKRNSLKETKVNKHNFFKMTSANDIT